MFGLVCELEYGISTFDSESVELELNGRALDTSGSSFVQIPSVVWRLGDQVHVQFTVVHVQFMSPVTRYMYILYTSFYSPRFPYVTYIWI